MSWLDSNYQRRAAISAPNTAGAATLDVDVVIPKDWDEFWTRIDASGLGLRITDADGRALRSYSVDDGAGGAWSTANRLGRVRIDGAAVPAVANSTALLWLYFEAASVTSGAVVTAMAAVVTGYVELGVPPEWVTASKGKPGLTRPNAAATKTAAGTLHQWWDLAPLLQLYPVASYGRLYYEELAAVALEAVDSVNAPAATLPEHTETRFVEVRTGPTSRRMFVRTRWANGTSPAKYTGIVKMLLRTPAATLNRTHQERVAIYVTDAYEPA